MSISLFSGLVGGLGKTLAQGYNRKAQEDHEAKMDEMHLSMSALMNDHNLPGSAKRLGLSKIFEITGIKPPEGLIESMVPDYQTESGQYEPEQVPETPGGAALNRQLPIEPPMPASMQAGHVNVADLGQAPAPQGGQQGWKSTSSGSGSPPMFGTGLTPMPRNPMIDPPQMVSSIDQQSSAPVTQKYTAGMGQADELDQKILEAQAKLRHGKALMRSSLTMSPQQMEDARSSRLRDEDQLRQIDVNKVSGLQQQRTQLDTFAREQQMRQEDTLQSIPKELQAKMSAIESINGPMTPEEKKKFLGINMTPQEQERYLESKDIEDSNNPNIPHAQRDAAGQRVLSRHLEIEGKIAAIRNVQAETVKRQLEASGGGELTSSQLSALLKKSTMQAGGEFGQKESDAYKRERTAYWSDWFEKARQGQAVAGADPTLQQWMSVVEKNPQAKANAVASKVEEDLKQYKQNMAQAIANAYVQNPGKQVYTLHSLRRAAEAAKSGGGDPNKFWDAIKSNPKVVILDDNLEPWNPDQ